MVVGVGRVRAAPRRRRRRTPPAAGSAAPRRPPRPPAARRRRRRCPRRPAPAARCRGGRRPRGAVGAGRSPGGVATTLTDVPASTGTPHELPPGTGDALPAHPVAQVAQLAGDPVAPPRRTPGWWRAAARSVRPGARRLPSRCPTRKSAGRTGAAPARGPAWPTAPRSSWRSGAAVDDAVVATRSRAPAPVRLRAAPGDQEDRKTQGRAGAGSSPAQPTSRRRIGPSTVGGHRKTGCMTSSLLSVRRGGQCPHLPSRHLGRSGRQGRGADLHQPPVRDPPGRRDRAPRMLSRGIRARQTGVGAICTTAPTPCAAGQPRPPLPSPHHAQRRPGRYVRSGLRSRPKSGSSPIVQKCDQSGRRESLCGSTECRNAGRPGRSPTVGVGGPPARNLGGPTPMRAPGFRSPGPGWRPSGGAQDERPGIGPVVPLRPRRAGCS